MIDIFSFSRGISVGILLIACFKIWLDYRHLIAGRLLFALFVGLQAYLIYPLLSTEFVLFDLSRWILAIFATLIPAVFWLFCASVFYDWDKNNVGISAWKVMLIVAFLCIAFMDNFFEMKALQTNNSLYDLAGQASFYLSYVMRFGFIAMAFTAMLSQWSQDLVESRRRLRTIMLAIGAINIAIVSFVELFLGGQAAPMWLEILNSLMLMLILLGIGSWFLVIQPDGFLNTLGVSKSDGIKAESIDQLSTELNKESTLSNTEEGWIAALDNVMKVEQVYHQPELSIGALGDKLSIPEHQLRKLINKHLGYRNFNDFLNKYRIEEASKRLLDPNSERLPILTIALDVGYASITPFNRAFKQHFQQTPSEYRKGQ